MFLVHYSLFDLVLCYKIHLRPFIIEKKQNLEQIQIEVALKQLSRKPVEHDAEDLV